MYPYFGLDGSIESLYHGRLLLAFTSKVLNTVALHQGLDVRVIKRFAPVGLYAPWIAWVRGDEHLFKCRRDCFGVLGMYRHCPGKLKEYINNGEQLYHSTVLTGDILHIGQVGLPLRIDSF